MSAPSVAAPATAETTKPPIPIHISKGEAECKGCKVTFPSRNAVFKHLKTTKGVCLTGEDYEHYISDVQNKERIKTVLLIGYLCSDDRGRGDATDMDTAATDADSTPAADTTTTTPTSINHGDDATQLVLDVIFGDEARDKKFFNRSYGNQSRGVPVTRQDEHSGAITEVLCVKMAPMDSKNSSIEAWIAEMNAKLEEHLAKSDSQVRILARHDMPHHKFNAEMDVSHRRLEYILPIDMVYNYSEKGAETPDTAQVSNATTTNRPRRDFELSFPTFNTCSYTVADAAAMANVKANGDDSHKYTFNRPDPQTLTYLHAVKKLLQTLCSQIVDLDPNDANAVMEKEFSEKKRKRQQRRKGDDKKKEQPKKKMVLRRKRFHNFTPRVMAHEYLAFRRLDRFYHRGTIVVVPKPDKDAVTESAPTEQNAPSTPTPSAMATIPKAFFRLSLTGDLFLHGQVPRVVGLMVALVSGRIPLDMVDCLFDEDYPHLVPAPAAPSFCLVSGEASYMNWEGKARTILTARNTKQFLDSEGGGGFNQPEVLARVAAWEKEVQQRVIETWLKDGADEDTGRLTAERLWMEQVLDPWAVQAKKQLEHYREWKATFTAAASGADVTTVSDDATSEPTKGIPSSLGAVIDTTVPDAYAKVLQCLRDADATGAWPSTTPKRQMVMVSTPSDEKKDGDDSSSAVAQPMSLAMAHVRAKQNKEDRSSAYAFEEGQGGASGSFSVGAFPGGQQPKGNEVFPELMKAAFELERALLPDREPSSTIAINRNAQFRPHTDSGAGAGQSRSLIVALGDYSGGELVVEGEQRDIRYNAIEFNGWTQRHWTMPFAGERYSLVWFTPKGCEGVRGVDLCK